jgi:hypothetical protein
MRVAPRLLNPFRVQGGRPITIQLVLVAEDPDAGPTTVSTTLEVNTADPRWPAWLVDGITFQAQEGARRLRDQLRAQPAIQASSAAADGFVPLAAIVPAAGHGR